MDNPNTDFSPTEISHECIRKVFDIFTFEVGGQGRTPHDVPSAALFTQAAKASIRSLQPSAPFSATLEEQIIRMWSIRRQFRMWNTA